MITPRVKGHDLGSGPVMSSGPDGSGYWVRCRCGWESGMCATAALADASGEQHLQIQHGRRRGRG